MYDLEFSEPVSNSWRILQDSRIREGFREAGKQADFDAMELWLQDVASGDVKSADIVNSSARMLKTNFTMAKLAFNVSAALQQVSTLSQTFVVLGKKDTVLGIQASLRPGITEEVVAKSALMASRQTTFNRDISDTRPSSAQTAFTSRLEDVREAVGPWAFFLFTKMQFRFGDVPTWLGGYHQGLRKFGNDEAKAIAHADDILNRAQGGGDQHLLNAFQRGTLSRTTRQSDVVRLFTALASYMFAKLNVTYERSMKAGKVFQEEGVSLQSAKEAVSLSIDLVFLFMLEIVVTAAIKGKLPNGEDEEDEGWAKWIAKNTAFSVMGMLPGVRDVAPVFQGFGGGGAYGAVTTDIGKGITSAASIVNNLVAGEGQKSSDVRAVLNGTGVATGLPTQQMWNTMNAVAQALSGEEVSPMEYLRGKSKK